MEDRKSRVLSTGSILHLRLYHKKEIHPEYRHVIIDNYVRKVREKPKHEIDYNIPTERLRDLIQGTYPKSRKA